MGNYSVQHLPSLVHPQILAIAKDCRKKCERFQRENESVFWDNLQNMCAVASAFLFDTLQKNGFASIFILGEFNKSTHCWIIVDKAIVDITATQFDIDHPVLVTHSNNPLFSAKIPCTTWMQIKKQ